MALKREGRKMARAKKLTRKGRPRKARPVSVPPLGGDHGTKTAAALAGTELIEIKNECGENPNHMGRRQRVNIAQRMMERGLLSMRQYQAADAIQRAYGAVQSLSSGGELKEQVDSSPKPDATVAAQVEANSRLIFLMGAVPQQTRPVVENVCFQNKPVTHLVKGRKAMLAYNQLSMALDLVANKLGY